MLENILQNFDGTYGFSPLPDNKAIKRYEYFLEQNYHGDLDYLKRHFPQKKQPNKLQSRIRSSIVFQKNYLPHPKAKEDIPRGLKIAAYAQGYDYHHWFLKEMQDIEEKLKQAYPEEEFLCFTDSGPVLERSLALQAGLGWIGKNACLIHPKKGSFFFIGEILTSLDLKAKTEPVKDHCGTCTRCIDACPTNAIKEERFIDARRCISYWTIEAKEDPPEDIRKNLDGWHFGCDICQDVCPWNQKVFGKEYFANKYEQDLTKIKNDVKWILTASNRSMERHFKFTPLMRASSKQQRKIAVITAVHHQFKDLLAEIQNLKQRFSALSPICDWAIKELS